MDLLASEALIERTLHMQRHVLPRQRQDVEALCHTFERIMLEQYPDEAAWVPLEPGSSRLHFNDEGLTIETHILLDRFTVPALRGRPERIVTRRSKVQPGYSVEALLESPHEIRVQAMFQFPALAQVILARHGRADLVTPFL